MNLKSRRSLSFLTLGLFPLLGAFSLAIICQTTAAMDWPILNLGEELAADEAAIRSGDPEALEDYDNVLRYAEAAYERGPFSVIEKDRTPPSGDKRDYLSLAPYWWPNPETENELPWVWRDGQINPLTRGNHVDLGRKAQLFRSIRALTVTAHLKKEPKYGEAADKILYHWFVNPESRMNPSLNYGQGIPGRTDGRPEGVIEWVGLQKMLTQVSFLDEAGHLSANTKDGLELWLQEFLTWLEESKIGKKEAAAHNNHGTWYDVLRVSILDYLGQDEKAREVLETVTKERIKTQIEPDGRQPHELNRTRTYSYSLYNLKAFKILASFGEKLGVDLKNYETGDGRSIQKASQFMQPYVEGKKKWLLQEIPTGLPKDKRKERF